MLKDILAIAGQTGLYKLISQTKNGIIVENLETKKRQPTYSSAKISTLSEIGIYTADVITSYSIHYTKLYEARVLGRPIPFSFIRSLSFV